MSFKSVVLVIVCSLVAAPMAQAQNPTVTIKLTATGKTTFAVEGSYDPQGRTVKDLVMKHKLASDTTGWDKIKGANPDQWDKITRQYNHTFKVPDTTNKYMLRVELSTFKDGEGDLMWYAETVGGGGCGCFLDSIPRWLALDRADHDWRIA